MVKICGITNKEDALASVEAGSNALGFNFYARSPRYITPERAREIVDAVPGDYLKVGIFVNAGVPELNSIARAVSLDVLQLHGDASGAIASLGRRIWRAVPAGRPIPQESFPIESFLIDSFTTQYGGSGKTFKWTLVAGLNQPFILAGGLDAGNVAEAIRTARPRGVDACSKLETAAGKKDHGRVSEFVSAAWAAFREQSMEKAAG
jgi:phosphoribosylanthranilate isomerase